MPRTLTGAARRPRSTRSQPVTQSAIVRDVLPNGLRLLTERMPHVRSVSIGVWLARGSRHEPQEQSGIAHFVEHMLFKGTATRTAEDIAQAIDSIGGQMDAFTAKEYASYYIKVLDEHLPFAVDVLSDIVMNPAFSPEDIEREKKVVLEEIKMVEDTPDDLVHELFTENFWANHPLGRPILGTKDTVESLNAGRAAPVLPGRVYRPEPDHRGRRQRRSRSACAISSMPRLRRAADDVGADHRGAAARWCRAPSSATRSSSRATSASAPSATGRITPTATRATC